MFISAAEKAKIFSTIASLESRIADLEKRPVHLSDKPKRQMSEKHKAAIRAALKKRHDKARAEKVGGTA